MKNVLKIAACLLAVVLCCVSVFVSVPTDAKTETVAVAKAEVKPLNNKVAKVEAKKVLEARFLNMLNHNFAYNEVYNSVEDLVNSSMPALLQLRDSVNEDYIANEIVADYIYNMYGVADIDFESINVAFEQIEGYTYIIPRGFTVYSHQNAVVTENEDGTYTVKTNVLVSAHDDYPVSVECETLFAVNEGSTFGFNIVFSNIDFGEVEFI